MNFSLQVRAWILLLALVVSSGGAVGLTSFLGGASQPVALVTGLITSATNVYHALAASPKEKADMARNATNPPIPSKL